MAVATAGVTASMSVGVLEGQTAVTSGSLGQVQYALNAGSGGLLPGWNPWFSGDSEVSTPAIADLYGTGQNEVIEGIGTSAGNIFNQQYAQGGHVRVILDTGNLGQQYPNGGQVCQLTTDEAVSSSPAVGHFLANSAIGIVTGTSDYYGGQGQPGAYTDAVVAMSPTQGGNCAQSWVAKLNGDTTPGPALADVLGNGQFQVVEGTNIGDNFTAGTVYVLNGLNGAVDWSAPASGAIIGSITTADLTGQGYQDLLVPTTDGVEIFDGKTGQLVATLQAGEGFQNSPLVTNDPNGTLGITIAGYNGFNQGVITHYEMAKPAGVNAYESGAWPMFHHDPQLTGDAGTAVTVQVPCNAPKTPYGYYMVGAGRRDLQLRGSRLLRLHRGPDLDNRSSGWPSLPRRWATGWSPATAASSPSATPASSARPGP